MNDDPEKKLDGTPEENVPADLDKAFEGGDDTALTPTTEDDSLTETPEPLASSDSLNAPDEAENKLDVPVEEPRADVTPLATPETPSASKPFQDVKPAYGSDSSKPQNVKVEVSNSFPEPTDSNKKTAAQSSNVPVFPNADMGAGTVNVFPKKTSAVPAVLATVFAILFVLALAALAWVLYVNDWNYSPKKTDDTSQTSTKTTSMTDSASTTPSTPTNVLKVKELGVQLTNLPSGIADVTYTATTNTDGSVEAVLTTPEIKAAAAADSNAVAGTCAIGTLTKVAGTYNSNQAKMGQTFVAQYNGFYLTFATPQDECSTTVATNAVVTNAQNAFTDYIKTPSNIVAL